MKAVFSHWSRPGRAFQTDAERELARLSVELATKHYGLAAGGGGIELVTDAEGAALLVDELGIAFDVVRTDLDDIPAEIPASLWCVGKLYAYALQDPDEPFVHLDFDVLLWKPLPDWLVVAEAFAQSDEPVTGTGLWPLYLPPFWYLKDRAVTMPASWPVDLRRGAVAAANCGVCGGPLLVTAAIEALEALDLGAIEAIAAKVDEDADYATRFAALYEQVTFATHVQAQGGRMTYLMPGWRTGDELLAEHLGYTHLWGPSKRDPDTMRRISARAAASGAGKLTPGVVAV